MGNQAGQQQVFLCLQTQHGHLPHDLLLRLEQASPPCLPTLMGFTPNGSAEIKAFPGRFYQVFVTRMGKVTDTVFIILIPALTMVTS